MSFVDFTEVKARCSVEQAAKFLGLKTSEERSQLRRPARHVAVDRFSPAFRRPASARTRCFRAAVNAAGSGTTSSTFTRYLKRIGRSVRAGLYSPAFAGRWYLTPISHHFARRRDAFRSMKQNLRYSSRDVSGKFTECVLSAERG